MKLLNLRTILFAATYILSSSAMATAVNLDSWLANGDGSWNLAPDNSSVTQTVNGYPTVFHNNQNSQGLALSGEITVQTTGDDDFIGFVLGYNNGDLTNSVADYLLIDWKQANQPLVGGTGLAGLAISRVDGALAQAANTHTSGAWWHNPLDGVTELQRATTLGSTGWADNTTYSFDLFFTSSLVEVFVNGNKELSIVGSFSNGSFGFYNYSQSNVLYAGIEETVVPAVPIPAAAFLFAPALLGFMGLRRKAKTNLAA